MRQAPRRGLPIVISAPSGCGKTTVVDELRRLRPELVRSISATTRPPRIGERDGVDYYFLTEEEFRRRIDEGLFAEYAQVHGHYYGTPEESLERLLASGRDVLLVIDVQGGLALKRAFPEAVTIFLLPPSMEELEARLRGRGTEPEDVIERRLANAKAEMDCAPLYQYRVVNDDVERAAREVAAIIDREVARACGEEGANGRTRGDKPGEGEGQASPGGTEEGG